MASNDLMIDAFERIKSVVHRTIEGMKDEDLIFRPTEFANSIAWLVWHLTRIQDDHIAGMANTDQVWDKKWLDNFSLSFGLSDTGYGHSSKDVAKVKTDAETLLKYFDEVHDKTISFIKSLKDEQYKKIVDTNWNPPVTLAVRLVSVISDNLQHAGQAAYVKGLIKP